VGLSWQEIGEVMTDKQIGSHFKRSEFACKCGCGFDTVDVELMPILEFVRFHFDKPVTINSACRCEAHNAAVGGSKNSQHLRGRAADIRIIGCTPDEIADALEAIMDGWGGLGVYPKHNFVHIDTRSGSPARWRG